MSSYTVEEEGKHRLTCWCRKEMGLLRDWWCRLFSVSASERGADWHQGRGSWKHGDGVLQYTITPQRRWAGHSRSVPGAAHASAQAPVLLSTGLRQVAWPLPKARYWVTVSSGSSTLISAWALISCLFITSYFPRYHPHRPLVQPHEEDNIDAELEPLFRWERPDPIACRGPSRVSCKGKR